MNNFLERYEGEEAKANLWVRVKTFLNALVNRPQFNEKEVWWCTLGVNVGDEENGKGDQFTRPVVVVKKFNKKLFLGIPLTGTVNNNDYYHKVMFKGKAQSAMISQVRALDSKRMQVLMGKMNEADFKSLKEAAREKLFNLAN